MAIFDWADYLTEGDLPVGPIALADLPERYVKAIDFAFSRAAKLHGFEYSRDDIAVRIESYTNQYRLPGTPVYTKLVAAECNLGP